MSDGTSRKMLLARGFVAAAVVVAGLAAGCATTGTARSVPSNHRLEKGLVCSNCHAALIAQGHAGGGSCLTCHSRRG